MLTNFAINTVLVQDFNNVIGFLNDIKTKFPEAVSFAAGMPDEQYFNVQDHFESVSTFIAFRKKKDDDQAFVFNRIGQYASCKGIVNDLVSRYLQTDEQIIAKQDQIIMTTGAQEAFSIIVTALCDRVRDVILVESPAYMGVSSFCNVFGYNVEGVSQNNGLDIDWLEKKILDVQASGKKVKLFYVIPDYQNPTGYCLPTEKRNQLIELAERFNFLIVEDGVYATFSYTDARLPSLKSLDKTQRVIYVGSFAKTIFPGLRIGFIVADQIIQHEKGEITNLIDELEKVKGLITNNTSTISQAMLGGILIKNNFTLTPYNAPKLAAYKSRYEAMMRALSENFPMEEKWTLGISWNDPGGGFFVTVTLPFKMGYSEVFECATKFKVIVFPMSNFYLNGGGENEIRLAFSNNSEQTIGEGIANLASYIKFMIRHESEILTELAINF